MDIKDATIQQLFDELRERKKQLVEECRQSAEEGLRTAGIDLQVYAWRSSDDEYYYVSLDEKYDILNNKGNLFSIYLDEKTIIPLMIILGEKAFRCAPEKLHRKILNFMKKKEILAYCKGRVPAE